MGLGGPVSISVSLHSVLTDSGAHPMDTWGGALPSVVKRQRREADHHLQLVLRSRKLELYFH
jgi:hypothetical protein